MSVPAVLSLGVDVSKGYADFLLLNASGTPLPPSRRFDDTPAGHRAVHAALASYLSREEVHLDIGIEASGGLERNWLRLFRSLGAGPGAGAEVRVYRLNPLAVKKFRDRALHQSVTDPLSAREIARYLQSGRQKGDVPYEESEVGALTLYRFLTNEIDRLIQLKNELHSLLPAAHPDLVQFCRRQMPDWVLAILVQYPTALQLSRARPATLRRIPHVSEARAQSLLEAARESVASMQDSESGIAIRMLAQQIRVQQRRIHTLKERVCRKFAADETVRILVSIPGVGLWTAVQLRLEVGCFSRFGSVEAVIAFAGLDPRYHESGDGRVEHHISKRGRPQIREALFMAAFAALRHNPVIRDYYHHLRRQGKTGMVALTACMAKLLRIGYACVVSGKEWDPEYNRRLAEHHEAARARKELSASDTTAVASPDAGDANAAETQRQAQSVGAVSAPVSGREAKKRAAATPQVGQAQRIRGRDATLAEHDSARGRAPQHQPA